MSMVEGSRPPLANIRGHIRLNPRELPRWFVHPRAEMRIIRKPDAELHMNKE
jgi:hypothetical protein